MPAKRSNATPAEKLLTLYTLLMQRGDRPASLGELASVLQCSKQTVLRLLAQLEASGYGKLDAPIRRGREHCYRLAFGLHDLGGDAREPVRLLLCRQMLRQLLPEGLTRLWDVSDPDREFARRLCLSPADVLLPAIDGAGAFTGRGFIDYLAYEAQYRCLLLALRQRHVCRVVYRERLLQEGALLNFAPLRLVIGRDALSFLGWLVDGAVPPHPCGVEPVSLLLHRCLKVEITERSSLSLPSFGAPEQEQTGGPAKQPIRVRALFAPQEADDIHDRRWSPRQDMRLCTDGSLLLDFDAESEGEVLSWLLGFGSHVVVLEPQWLRERIRQQARLMLRAYQSEA